jgi:two-component system, NarL family, sensor histidine kinase DesK
MLTDIFRMAPDSIACRHAQQGKLRHTVLFNLVWTIWIFADFLFNDHVDGSWFIATFVSFPIFIALYLLGYSRSRRYIGYFATCMALLGYAVMNWNHSGGTSYVIYACAYFAFFGSGRRSFSAMLVTVLLYAIVARWQEWPWVIIVSMCMVCLSVGLGNLMYRVTNEKDAVLRLSHEEVRRLAANAERERIGRDLHDLLGHTLSLITLKSELAHRLFDRDPATAKREIAEVERVARDALAQVRRAVTGIRAAGIAAELASAKLLLESNGVGFEYSIADVALPVDVETALAMTVREAVTNAQRHAHANLVQVRVDASDGRLVLSIADDGRGGTIVPGNGLSGMRERLQGIGAELRVESERGRGTTLKATVPWPHAAAPASERTPVPVLRSA